MAGKSPTNQSVSSSWFFEAKEAVEVIEASDVIMSVEVIKATEVFKTTLVLEINKLMAKWLYFDVLKKNISEQNDGISSEILPSFRTEALEDTDIIFNQTQGS